ncbi:MAG TPA: WYL domain-containing protein [Gemmatimonadaceae bacterium]
MSDTAAEQLRRLLYLLPRIADGEEHPIDEVASLAGVSREALLAELGTLVERYDAPGGFVEGVQIYLEPSVVSVFSSHFQRPMRLTMPELCALELGLAIARASRASDEHAVIDRALARLREAITALPANERHEELRHAELAFAGSAAHLAIIRRSLRDRRKVELCYRSGGATSAARRVVSPYTLVFSSGMWYVVGSRDDGEGLRFFRLDRIEGVTLTDERFAPPDPGTIDAVLRSGRAFHAEAPATMTVRYSPRIARWIAEREGVPVDADGSLTMEHPLADRAWALRHVLQYGPDAEVLAPAALRAEIAERLDAMSRG